MAKQIKLRPEQKVGEKEGLNRHWVGLFLDTLAETSNVSASARMAGCNPSRAYKLRREDASFRQRWNEALLEGYEHLELEVLGFLRDPAPDRKMDVASSLRLLASHRETVAREKALREEEDEAQVLERLNAKIDLMRQREAEMRQILREEEGQAGSIHGDD